jgi:transcription-repair coupling factor (superfamily II helicase)
VAEYDGRRLIFGFHPTTKVAPDVLLQLIQDDPQRYTLSPDFKIAIRIEERGDDFHLIEEAKKPLQAFYGA